MNQITPNFADLADRALSLPDNGRRSLIAIAGPPGSGKSTLAETLSRDLAALGRPAQIVPMDGFHYDNAILTAMGLLERKGAPETFDLRGFTRTVAALGEDDNVSYPVFDRHRDIAIAGAGYVGPCDDLVIVEGNYLLFDSPGWRDLARHWTLSVWLNVPAKTLEERLVLRWLNEGLDPKSARARVHRNDLPNAEQVQKARLASDVEIGDFAA